jgi:hypothetical protein
MNGIAGVQTEKIADVSTGDVNIGSKSPSSNIAIPWKWIIILIVIVIIIIIIWLLIKKAKDIFSFFNPASWFKSVGDAVGDVGHAVQQGIKDSPAFDLAFDLTGGSEACKKTYNTLVKMWDLNEERWAYKQSLWAKGEIDDESLARAERDYEKGKSDLEAKYKEFEEKCK